MARRERDEFLHAIVDLDIFTYSDIILYPFPFTVLN